MSNIKINDVPQRIQYSATGGQTQFSVPFPFFANSYVYVWLNGIQLVQGGAPGQYTVTGAGSPSGGLVTFNTAATLNDIVTIEGIMPIDRTSIYSATISNLTGSDLNGDFNREVVMLQQLNTTQSFMQLQYAPWAVISQDLTVTKDRYIPLLLPNQVWAMNDAGTEIIGYDVPSGGGIAPSDATYLLQVADSELPNAQAMGALASGFVVNTLTTGVQLSRVLTFDNTQLNITNADGIAGNPLFEIAENVVLPGIEGFVPPVGTTAQRPVSPVDGQTRFNTDLQALEFYGNSTWSPTSGGVVDSVTGTLNQVDVDNSDPINPVLSLSATLDLPGTFTIQNSIDVNEIINDDTMATAAADNLATALSIKNYVDSIAAGFTLINPVRVATTGAFTGTYANGTAGVGATLTASVNGAASIDSVSLALNDRVLFNNQASTFQNGIYRVSQVGDGGTPAIYMRATDFDEPDEIEPGDLVPVLEGTVNQYTLWLQTATVTTIGTDPITFVQFGASFSNVVTLTGTQTITGDKTFTGVTTLDNFVFDTNQMQHLADTNNYFEFGTDTQNFVTGGSSRMDLSDTGFRLGAANSRVTTILDEDNMVSDSATALATQQSIKAYVDQIGGFKSVQVITASGPWTRPSGIKKILAMGVSGGGGGGYGNATGGNAMIGSGGAGGGFSQKLIDVTSIASISATIGAAGAGGIGASSTASTAGGVTSFGAHFSIPGGLGGSQSNDGSGNNIVAGAQPGAAPTGGDINISGSGGGEAQRINATVFYGGLGGASHFSGGGGQVANASSNGGTPNGYGGGGGGGCAIGVATVNGGAGSPGLIVVYEFA